MRAALAALAPVLTAGAVTTGAAPAAMAQQEPERTYLVTFADGTPDAREAATVDAAGADGTPRDLAPDTVAVELTAGEAAALAARGGVVAVEPDAPARAAYDPNDPCFRTGVGCSVAATQTGLRRIGAQLAWDVVRGAPTATDVVVAVLDTGVDAANPDLTGRVVQVPPGPGGCAGIEADYNPPGGDGSPELGTVDQTSISHGTRVAGIIAAAGDDGFGVSGVVGGPVTVRSYQVLRSDLGGRTVDVVAALNCAVDDGVDVINLSLVAGQSVALADAVRRATDAGIVVVAAAGNEGRTTGAGSTPTAYPAGYAEVVAVAATDDAGTRAGFSNGGAYVDIAAPGVNVLSTVRTAVGTHSNNQSGTSFAAPFVTGAAALVLARDPGLSVAAVRARLEGTAEPLTDANLGAGLLDLSGAVRFPVSGSPACASPRGYAVDGWGGVHATGGAPLFGAPYWPGWDIARDIDAVTGGYYVLDGFGGVHARGSAPVVRTGNAYWPGWDIARAVAARPDGAGVYVLDGWGGVHLAARAGATPTIGTGGPYWPGWDIARDIAVDPTDSRRGFVLDGYGGVHAFGFGSNPPAVTFTGYTPGRDLARRLVVLPDGSGGYVLDATGHVRRFAVGANPLPPAVAAASTLDSAARGLDLAGDSPVLASGTGSVIAAGSVPCTTSPTWPGWDILRGYATA